MADALGRTIVVPIANPASARPLMSLAARIAARDHGTLIPVTVIRPHAPADERAAAWLGLADAEEVAREFGAPVAAEVVEDEHVAAGVLALATRVHASLVLMGWRGRSSTTDVFGRLTDTIVGRSAIPLAVVRFGTAPYRRLLLPVGPDHLQPAGQRGLELARDLACRIGGQLREPTRVLRTGSGGTDLPAGLGALGAVLHDERRTDQAVAAVATAEDLVVAPVAPTATGLRAATTHLAWAAPDATLLVAVDVGPTATTRSSPTPATSAQVDEGRPVRVVVTARLSHEADVDVDAVAAALGTAGTPRDLMAWWPAGDDRPHVRATVTVAAASANAAIAAVMVAVHDATPFHGAELSYDVDRGPPPPDRLTVRSGSVEVSREPGGHAVARRRPPERPATPTGVGPGAARGSRLR